MNTEQSSKNIFPYIKQSKLNCESFSFHTSQYTELRQNVTKNRSGFLMFSGTVIRECL